MSPSVISLIGILSVSYTHLDVYKRQEKLYALGRNLEKMLGRPLYSFTSTVRSGLGA